MRDRVELSIGAVRVVDGRGRRRVCVRDRKQPSGTNSSPGVPRRLESLQLPGRQSPSWPLPYEMFGLVELVPQLEKGVLDERPIVDALKNVVIHPGHRSPTCRATLCEGLVVRLGKDQEPVMKTGSQRLHA